VRGKRLGVGITRPTTNIKSTLVFSILIFLSFAVRLGPGLHLLLVVVFVVPLANLFFFRWASGPPIKVTLNLILRASQLFLANLLLVVVFIKYLGSGQLGYGDQLQIDGSYITQLGYLTISTECAVFACSAFVAAMIATRLFSQK
jgi:hypothetical protein